MILFKDVIPRCMMLRVQIMQFFNGCVQVEAWGAVFI